MPALYRPKFVIVKLTAAVTLLALISWLPGPALGQAELQPVQFLLSGDIQDDGQSPLDRVEITVLRAGAGEVLAERVFTAGDGHFEVTFQAEILIEVGLGDREEDPLEPQGAGFDGFWMGEIWPNPYLPAQGRGVTIPFAAPGRVQTNPELEMYDARGRRVRGGDVMASGVYFYRLRFDDRVTKARKLIVVGATQARFSLERVAAPAAVTAARDGELGGGAKRDASMGKRAEGTLDVDVVVKKAGYVTQQQQVTLDSTLNNQVAASLSAESPPTSQLLVTGSLVVGESVLFDGVGSTAPDGQGLVYSWDFGDGVRGGGEVVAHVYSETGSYTIELTVSSTYGATAMASQAINIIASTPPASIDAVATGTVRDAIGNLLEGVVVSLVDGSSNGVTDAQGSVDMTGLPTGVPIALRFDKSGYTQQVVRLVLPANTTNSEFYATLRRQRTAVSIADIEDGARVEGEDGACIELPADALQKTDGTPASGAAGIRLTPIDVTNDLEAGAFPGAYEGVLTDGDRGLIVSFGAAEFVIEQGGEELQLKPGSTAVVEIPIYTAGAALDDQIPLWSVDESTGLWVEEGLGTVVANPASPTGMALRAEVTHFSWWNCDDFLGEPYTPIPECKIVDSNGFPTLEIPPGGACYIEGKLLTTGGPTTRPSVNVPPGGGIPLSLPPNLDVQLSASAVNGTKRGVAVVNGASNVSEVITIALDDPAGTPNELLLPADFEATIDPEGELDRYTFDAVAGQFFNVYIEPASGSSLVGSLTVLAPDDSELHMSNFGPSSTAFAHEVAQSGTFTLEVDGTAFEPGAYHLIAAFSEPYSMTIPSSVDEEILPGAAQVFLISATAGDWFSLNYLRREVTGVSTRKATLQLYDPSGALVSDQFFDSAWFDSGLFQASETGVYRAFLISDNTEAAYTFFVRDTPQILIGGALTGSADERSTQYYRFAASQGDFVRSSLDRLQDFVGNISIVDRNNDFVFGTNDFRQVDGWVPVVIPTTDDYFVRVEANFGGTRVVRDYRISLNDLLPPRDIALDSSGHGEILDGRIGLFGDYRFFQFVAAAGSGATVELRAGAGSTMGVGASIQVLRIGSGSYFDPEEPVNPDFLTVHNGDASVGILQFDGMLLPATDTYVIVIAAPTPQDGAFTLAVDAVAPAANLTVDDDLVDCPTATTRSVVAAGLAAPPGATISICPGTYNNIVPIPLGQPGIELVGSAAGEVMLRHEIPGSLVFAQAAPARIANLTLELADPIGSRALFLTSTTGAVIEDLVIRAASEVASSVGIDITNGNSDITVRRVRVEGMFRSIEADADNVLIEDCVFDGSAGMIDIFGNQTIVRNNTWTCDAVGQVMQIKGGAGHQVLDNLITVSTTDGGAGAGTKAIEVEDDDVAGNLPTTVVRGNQITTNEAGFDLQVNRTGSAILCEQNLVHMTAAGQTALVVIPLRNEAPDVVIQNNVFNGVSYFEGVHLRWADWYGSLRFLNNTMKADTQGPVQAGYPTVLVDLSNGSSFTGALPVLFVNNVMQGPAAATAIEVPTGTTIDSDYNLMDAYSTYYADGGTSTGLNDLLGQDPLFQGNLLELDPNSPGVDTGAGTGDVAEVPTTDFDGEVRPQGAGTDRGAHER